jgi:hypothetical protein
MTIVNASGGLVEGFSCDGCSMSYEADDSGEFSEVWPEARKDGWRAVKENGKWVHYCPVCMRGRS